MAFLEVLAIGILLAAHPVSGEPQFVEAWKNYDEQVTVGNDRRELRGVRRKIELSLASLPEYTAPLSPPAGVEANPGKKLVLYAQNNYTLLLVTPPDTMDGTFSLDEHFRQAVKSCAADRSWLVVLPDNTWTRTGLNPYCSMNYGIADIELDLYWTRVSTRPLVEIVTNGLSCVPHELYGWDQRSRMYKPLAEKCTGMKTVESYQDTGGNLKQVL